MAAFWPWPVDRDIEMPGAPPLRKRRQSLKRGPSSVMRLSVMKQGTFLCRQKEEEAF